MPKTFNQLRLKEINEGNNKYPPDMMMKYTFKSCKRAAYLMLNAYQALLLHALLCFLVF